MSPPPTTAHNPLKNNKQKKKMGRNYGFTLAALCFILVSINIEAQPGILDVVAKFGAKPDGTADISQV